VWKSMRYGDGETVVQRDDLQLCVQFGAG
jgi:hypothetical protein